MALTGIPRVDGLFQGSPAARPIRAGDTDRPAVGCAQDLLAGHGYRMPNLASGDYGVFGPKTAAAVRAFRKAAALPDGDEVDVRALAALVARDATVPRASRAYLALALDCDFSGLVKILCFVSQVEGAGLFAAINANTDRQGLSYGLIQWAQGQVRLPELLNAYSKQERDDFVRILGGGDAMVADGLLAHVAKPRGGTDPDDGTTTDPRFDLVAEPWVGRFREAGLWRPFQNLQVVVGVASLQASLNRLRKYAADMTSERCVAFMLDLANQRGDGGAKKRYLAAQQANSTPNEILQRIADADPAYGPRHAFFLETDLLSDEELSPQPAAAAETG